MGWRVVTNPQQKLLSILAYFFSLQHILKYLSVSVCALLFSAVRRTLALRDRFVFREMRDYVASSRRQRGDRLRQSLLMTQMKYEGIVRERADRKDEGSSLIAAPIYDGYVSSLALWLSRRWRVASVCFRGARRDVTARRARASARRLRRIHPALPPSFTRLFLVFLSVHCCSIEPRDPLSGSPNRHIYRFCHRSTTAVKTPGEQTDLAPDAHLVPVRNRK